MSNLEKRSVNDVLAKARANLDATCDPPPVDRNNVTRDVPTAVEHRPRINTAMRAFQEKLAARRARLGIEPTKPEPAIEVKDETEPG